MLLHVDMKLRRASEPSDTVATALAQMAANHSTLEGPAPQAGQLVWHHRHKQENNEQD